MATDMTADVIVVGAGLSGCLTAWRMRHLAPQVRVRLFEAGDRLGGNHTWSFFETDLTKEQNRWIDPLVTYRWPAYSVRFPDRWRTITTGYCSITSDRLHEILAPIFGDTVTYGVRVFGIDAGHVQLSSGEAARAPWWTKLSG